MAAIAKKDEKVAAAAAALPIGFSQDQFAAKFKELYPRDWERIQKAYRDHERNTKLGKSHPMPTPEQYLKNCFNTLSKARWGREKTVDIHRVESIARSVRRAIEMCNPTELPWPTFPRGACGDTSLILGQVLHDAGIKGFEYVCGNKYSDDGARCSSHAWLKNGELIVDITADQFPAVRESVIVTNRSEWHQQWIQDRPTPGTLEAHGTQVPQLWRLLSILKPRLDD